MSLGKVIIVAFDHFKKLLTCRKLTSQMLKFMFNKNKETREAPLYKRLRLATKSMI